MASVEEVLIPTLLCLMGVLLWNTGSSSFDSDQILLRSHKRAKDIPDTTHVHDRLRQLGRESDYANFRLRQIFASLMGAAGGFFVATLMTGHPILAFCVSGFVGIGIYYVIDHRLSKDVASYRREIESEFASVIEMLTLSLSAGETPVSAMTRISQRSNGLLAAEFTIVIDSVRSGIAFHESLDTLGRRIESVVIRRFVDSLVTAMLRGAPLIEVLQRHAAEARQNQRNLLMDKAGKAEISMMIPVVFLILPISVLFALWPSLTHLNIFAA